MTDKIINRVVTADDITLLNDMQPFDLVSLYATLDPDSQKYFITLLNEETYADMLSFLEPEDLSLIHI